MLFKSPWKRIVDSGDLITYETSASDFSVRIEARKNEDDTWSIFKTYLDEISYTEEYRAKTRNEAQDIVSTLQKERLLTKKELHLRKLHRAKRITLKLKRQFKDYNVERWVFAVSDENYENTMYIRDADVIDVTIIIAEKHRPMEIPILQEIHAILGLDISDFDVKQEVYYYTTRSEDYVKTKKGGIFVGRMEMGFDMMDEG